MRRIPFVFVLVVLAAGCGGSDERDDEAALVSPAKTTTTSEEPSLPEWVEERLAAKSGPDVAVVRGTSDHAVGTNRISFLVVRKNGALVSSPRARVLLAREGNEEPVETTATLVPLGSHAHPEGATEGHSEPDATELSVANVELFESGRYWVLVEPAGEGGDPGGRVDRRARGDAHPVDREQGPPLRHADAG